MKPSRGMRVWSVLAVCAALVFGAMAWLTRNMLESKSEQALAEARAALEEQTRLALWRMDAAGSAIVLRENQRPPMDAVSIQIPEAPEVRARFTLVDGSDKIEVTGASSDAGAPPLSPAVCSAAVSKGELAWQAMPKDNGQLKQQAAQQKMQPPQQNRYNASYQEDSNRIELAQRAKVLDDQAFLSNSGSVMNWSAWSIRELGVMRPVWIDGELYLLRRIEFSSLNPTGMIQGVWLDSSKVRALLLAEVADLLEGADLKPRLNGGSDPLSLVSLPFSLERGGVTPVGAVVWGAPLIAGWIAVLCAIAMAALLVHGVMRLSERRASFVSAVTHELRTPLTTFRLYSDMLESGAVKPEKRGDYLRVLSREADRLSHLVENVLAFPRIERGNARSNVSEVAAGDLLVRSRERLEARLATAGLALEMDASCRTPVRADTAAVEHILFNLIDNAAKYAASSEPPVVRVSAKPAGRFVEIAVCDHGPGIPPAEHARIFRPFHKSAREAAESQPGVGLGLALSRRLARAQRGDLATNGSGRGACFLLRLPRTTPRQSG